MKEKIKKKTSKKKDSDMITIGVVAKDEMLMETKHILVVKKANGDIVFRDFLAEYEIGKVTVTSAIF